MTRGVLDLLDRADQILADTQFPVEGGRSAARTAKNRLHNVRLHIQEARRMLDRHGSAPRSDGNGDDEVTGETQPGVKRRP